jgi:hypothetical protein
MALAIAFVIVISLMKVLFLPPSTRFHLDFRPTVPDGKPPLALILDTASFVGGVSVPIGLICLGSECPRAPARRLAGGGLPARCHLRTGPGNLGYLSPPRIAHAALELFVKYYLHCNYRTIRQRIHDVEE